MNLLPFCIISLLLALDFEVASGCCLRWKSNKFCRLKGMVPNVFSIKTDTNGQDEDKFEIVSEDVKEYEILLSEEPIGEGSFGKVYHAHPAENLLDFDGKPIGHCVALKMVMDADADDSDNEDNENLENEVRILKEFAKLEGQQHRHLVKLYQAGEIMVESTWKKAYIMELGQMSLDDYLRHNADKLSGKQIRKVVKDVALAMHDFHRVAIHLDLKPENMMYFKEPKGARILKAIDFGSSTLLDRSHSDNRANICERIYRPVGTERYDSPEKEYENGCIHVTPKADIWSIGLMIYEVILWNSQDLEFFYYLRGIHFNMEKMIEELNDLYKYDKQTWIRKRKYAIRKEIKEQKKEDAKKGQYRVYPSDEEIKQKSSRDYAAYVYLVLKVSLDHPILYELINSCLEHEPTERPSAFGILEYLERKCFVKYTNAKTISNLLDQDIIDIILNHLEERIQELNKINCIRRIFSKQRLHLKELQRIKDFLTGKSELNLRTFGKGKGKINEQSTKWCDTQISHLPMYKRENISGLNIPPGNRTPEHVDIARAQTSNSLLDEIEENLSTPLLGRHR